MKTEIWKIADIKPAPYNPRVTLKPGDQEWDALDKNIERYGLVEPLIINTTTGLLVSGHQRLNVLKAQGQTEAEVVLVELDEGKEKLLNIALNKIDGAWDYSKLEALFKEFNEEDVQFTGFAMDELENLFGTEEPDYGEDESDGGNAETAGSESNSVSDNSDRAYTNKARSEIIPQGCVKAVKKD